mmetsp:Transcript_17442/g.19598  ORF Transcript_17442/g.19598 Transcript_17442/m.19598 type:complete len:109 (+) Transcript_17442:382-708(+)
MDLKIYVNEDSDVRLCRRVLRDISERDRTVESVINQWHKTVKPSYDEFIHPTLKFADIIINGNNTSQKAIQFIVDNLKHTLEDLLASPNHLILIEKVNSRKNLNIEES